jgi:hypothetical protein
LGCHPRLGRRPWPAVNPVNMDKPCFYEIRVEGHLTERWSEWFEALAVHADPNGETILSGWLTDQAVLFGVLSKIHALNLVLVSVNRSN